MAMLLNHLHHDNGLANTGAAEHPHFAAAGKGHQQVDDLDAGFQHATSVSCSVNFGAGR
jgi:hypothetical protein